MKCHECHECPNCTKITRCGKEIFVCFKNWIEKEVDPSDECEESLDA